MAGIAVGGHAWYSLFFTLQSNFFSAGLIRSSKLTLCEYPARCSFRRNRSTRSLSAALAQPHHAGAAYRRRLIAVALHTVNSASKWQIAYIKQTLLDLSHVGYKDFCECLRVYNRKKPSERSISNCDCGVAIAFISGRAGHPC